MRKGESQEDDVHCFALWVNTFIVSISFLIISSYSLFIVSQ
jgi:hypothetical protein